VFHEVQVLVPQADGHQSRSPECTRWLAVPPAHSLSFSFLGLHRPFAPITGCMIAGYVPGRL